MPDYLKPYSYWTALGQPFPYQTIDQLIENALGFTPAGTFLDAFDYIISEVGGTYYKSNAYQTLDSDADFEVIYNSCKASNIAVAIKGAGPFEISSKAGISHEGITDFYVKGFGQPVLKYTYPNALSGAMMYRIGHGLTDMAVEGLTFDMNRGTTANPTGYGADTIIKVTSDTGDDITENVSFNHCKFINGPGCGTFISGVKHVYFNLCGWNNIGEHPVYMSKNTDNVYNYDVHFTHCRFLNWAKYVRGYFKLQEAYNTIIENSWFHPNEDELGIPTAGAWGGATYGAYGLITNIAEDTTLHNCKFIGDYTAHPTWYNNGINIEASDNTVLDNIQVDDWKGIYFDPANTNTKLLHGKYIDSPFDGTPTVATQVEIVTGGVSSYYNLGGVAASLIHHGDGTVELGDYPSGTTHTNKDQTEATITLNLPDVDAGAVYFVVALLNTDNRIRLYPPSGEQLYFNGTMQAINARIQNDSHTINDSVKATCSGDGNWIITDVTGTWNVV